MCLAAASQFSHIKFAVNQKPYFLKLITFKTGTICLSYWDSSNWELQSYYVHSYSTSCGECWFLVQFVENWRGVVFILLYNELSTHLHLWSPTQLTTVPPICKLIMHLFKEEDKGQSAVISLDASLKVNAHSLIKNIQLWLFYRLQTHLSHLLSCLYSPVD